MNLHENKDTFRNAIRAASDHLGVRDEYIEKDYWVTFLLKRLSLSPHSKNVVFKGGTSLSKVHKLIARFSEDVDLAILKSEGQSETQIRNMIRSIEKEITKGFDEVVVEEITSKKTNFRKSAYNYDRTINPDSPSGVQEKLILEINSFANPVPYEMQSVNSMIAQFFLETGNEKSIESYNLDSFKLNVLVPQSTLIEKVLSLVRLSFFEDSTEKIKSKVRHFYDIYFLSKSPFCKDYLISKEFKIDFDRMFAEDKTKFEDPEEWLKAHYTDAPIFKSFDEIWNKVKGNYETDFRLLVYGEFPGESQIAEQFRALLMSLE